MVNAGAGLAVLALPACLAADRVKSAKPATAVKPNIIFILADDMAQGDLGSFGQKKIKTPNLDRMAAEGMRFTQLYTGTSVCAPSRASLMTGQHMGHCPIRANREVKPEGQMPLPEESFTVAQLLKDTGYATACTGKWGLGMFDTTGSPLKKGFDHFFGYNCQFKAHSYFPKSLYSDDKSFELDGKTYSPNLVAEDTLKWIRAHAGGPFFLFFATTLPHTKLEIDSVGEYASTDWPERMKTYAAMCTRLDSDVGRIMALLKELKLDEKTIVFFSGGDNGSSFPPEGDIGQFFNQATDLQLRGFKRSMYEGGLRQGAIVRWPGKVPDGKVCNEPWAFWDFLPTCAELAGIKVPDRSKTDGLSVVPALIGGEMPKHPYFYWELHEKNFIQAARFGNWKIVNPGKEQPHELYDLSTDPGEKTNLAGKFPEILEKGKAILKTARTESSDWPTATNPGKQTNLKESDK
ncbi:MAG: hypothetical protein A2X48_00610 [Lentisphaerae bacterium GWF2_49_21]|nr:MAG: hypothetical protein A2X48_00610 [Lentisphaerae bacterium GWF2_49_21]